jgi:alkylation response protein AidB-like acyl-CoA dehydrogenase
MSYPQIPADFGFAEEHEVLRQSARRFLEERCPLSEVRRLAESPRGHDPALWKEIAGLGWLGLPEAHGGAGLGHLHLALLLEETGRRLLPAPLFAAILAGFALKAAGSAAQRARLEPALASGDLVATFALCDASGGWEPGEIEASADARQRGFVLRGVKPFVIAGAEAGLVIAPFREHSGELALFAVDLPTRLPPRTRVAIEVRTGIGPLRMEADVLWTRRVAGKDGVTRHGLCLAGRSEVMDLPIHVLLGEWLKSLARREAKEMRGKGVRASVRARRVTRR